MSHLFPLALYFNTSKKTVFLIMIPFIRHVRQTTQKLLYLLIKNKDEVGKEGRISFDDTTTIMMTMMLHTVLLDIGLTFRTASMVQTAPNVSYGVPTMSKK